MALKTTEVQSASLFFFTASTGGVACAIDRARKPADDGEETSVNYTSVSWTSSFINCRRR